MNPGGFQAAGGRVLVEVCGLALAEAAEGVGQAEQRGGVTAGAADSGLERAAGELLQIGDGLVKGEDGAGKGFRTFGERAAAVADSDGERAEQVRAVGHAGCGHAVGDQDGVVGFEAEPKTNEQRRDVDAVADELGVEIGSVEHGAEHAGFTVIEGAHGVEGVGCGACSGGERGLGFSGGGIAMAERDANAGLAGVASEFGCAGKLRCEGEQADVAAGSLLEAIEEGDRGWLQQVAGMGAAFGVGEERAFEVDADGRGLVGGRRSLDGVGERLKGAERFVDRRGDGGGQVVRGAAASKEALQGAEFGGRGKHDIVASRAVDVDVEEGGSEDGLGADACVGGDVRDEAGVIDGDGGIGDAADGGDEGASGEDRHDGAGRFLL